MRETPWIRRKTTIAGMVLCVPLAIGILAEAPLWALTIGGLLGAAIWLRR